MKELSHISIADLRMLASDRYSYLWYCQVNNIQTAQPIDHFILILLNHVLGARHRLPFTECPRTKLAIVNRSRQVPTLSEQIAYYTINCKKALCLSSWFKPPHLSFALTSRFMWYLSSVVFVLFSAVCNRRQYLPVRSWIALQFICNHSLI